MLSYNIFILAVCSLATVASMNNYVHACTCVCVCVGACVCVCGLPNINQKDPNVRVCVSVRVNTGTQDCKFVCVFMRLNLP